MRDGKVGLRGACPTYDIDTGLTGIVKYTCTRLGMVLRDTNDEIHELMSKKMSEKIITVVLFN